MTETDLPICVAALYHFTPFADCQSLRQPLADICAAQGVKGTLLLAPEGINGTIAGPDEGIERVLEHIRALPGAAGLVVKFSRAESMPFHRSKVRIKREIVTMGQPNIDPLADVGHYVLPQDWNALISDPDTILIDTRNDYEVEVGTFTGAIDPRTKTFRDFPEWFRGEREKLLGQGKQPKIAMYCTGGIRCEKSTAFLKAEGLDEVYHLKGGILKYLETIPADESMWEGECFVFDQRVTVAHGLVPGNFKQCFACRRPVSEEEVKSPHYVEGVSCAACHEERTAEQRASALERQKQSRLAKERGLAHIGAAQNGALNKQNPAQTE